MIKVDLITGFLGSGKTTFIKRYAKYQLDRGEKIGILVNDYGAINVDMVLLQELRGGRCELEMVTGGDGHEAHLRRFRTKLIAMAMSGYTRVIIEPSGIFDPDEFFDVLAEEPLSQWYEIGSVIAIVDPSMPETLSADSDYLLGAQCAVAGSVVFSRTDSLEEPVLNAAAAHINRALAAIQCSRRFQLSGDGPLQDARKDPEELQDVRKNQDDRRNSKNPENPEDLKNLEAPELIRTMSWARYTEEDFAALSACGYRQPPHLKLPVERENLYESRFLFEIHMDREELKARLEALFRDSEVGDLMRVKGIVQEPSGTWIEVNADSREVRIRETESDHEVLILIGERLKLQRLKEYWEGEVR